MGKHLDVNKELEELKNKITPLNTAKFVTGTVISLGAAAAVMELMKNPLKGVKGLSKLAMQLGVFVVGCKIGDVAEQYFNDVVDEIVKGIKDIKKEMAKA